MKMSKFIVLAFIASIFFIASCGNGSDGLNSDIISNSNSADGGNTGQKQPVISFENTEHDFGRIVDGVKVSYTFKFKNTGDGDLIIHQVKSSCGCTATKFSKEVIPPGGKGKIQLTFDSSNRPGMNHKTARVVTNTQPNTHILRISAQVVDAKSL